MSVIPAFTIVAGQCSSGIEVVSWVRKPVVMLGEYRLGREKHLSTILTIDQRDYWYRHGSVVVPGFKIDEWFDEDDRHQVLLHAAEEVTDDFLALVLLKTPLGVRSKNLHLGDLVWSRARRHQPKQFEPFPGEILAKATLSIAPKEEIRPFGQQLLAVVMAGQVFSTRYPGGLTPGGPTGHFYVFDGQQIRCVEDKDRANPDFTSAVSIVR